MFKPINYEGTTAGNIAVGAASVNAALPANTEFLVLCTAGACHWRTGVGAQTAVATDQLIVPNTMIVIKLPQGHNNIAVIQDGASTGNFNFAKCAMA
jgi:hypothetical protein